MEFDPRQPIYIQIMDKIKQDIISGRLQKGEKLNSGRMMAEELKVNVNTIQRVYQELEKDAVIFTLRGKGSYITEDEEVIKGIKDRMARERLRVFVEGMAELGFDRTATLKCLKDYMEEDQK